MVGCAHAHLGPGCSWSWGRKLAGVGNPRRPAAVTAAARAPARLRLVVDNKWTGGVECYLGKVLGGVVWNGDDRRRRCSGGGGNDVSWRGWQRGVAWGRGETRRPLYSAARCDGGETTRGSRRATAPRPARVRPAPRTHRGSTARTAHVQRTGDAGRGVSGEGEHWEAGPWAVHGLWRCSASGRAWGRGRRGPAAHRRDAQHATHGQRDVTAQSTLPCSSISLVHCLSEIFSKNLNKSWLSFEYESCGSSHPLQLSKSL
jgi:hypothetical protein